MVVSSLGVRAAEVVELPLETWASIPLEQRQLLDVLGRSSSGLRVVRDAAYRAAGLPSLERRIGLKRFSLAEASVRWTLEAYVETLSTYDRPPYLIVEQLGNSEEDRPIRALRLSNGEPEDRPVLVITGLLHAREWSVVDSLMGVLAEFTAEPPPGDLAAILDQLELVFVPVVNPDGYVHSYLYDALWRKNRRPNGAGAVGVDLNRNFPIHFNVEGNTQAASPSFPGLEAGSEPETKVLMGLLEREQVVGLLDVHAYSQLLLHPWAAMTTPSQHHELLQNTLLEVAAAMVATNGGVSYRVGRPADLLSYLGQGVGGSLMDYAHDRGTVHSYAVELRPTEEAFDGFHLEDGELRTATAELRAAILTIAREVVRWKGDASSDGGAIPTGSDGEEVPQGEDISPSGSGSNSSTTGGCGRLRGGVVGDLSGWRFSSILLGLFFLGSRGWRIVRSR